jgi:biopolymer transport protein ExbB/TolQ
MKKIITSPLLFGGALSFVFYFAIHKGWIASPLVHRYFAGHPVEYITTVMFFVGLSVLAVKFIHALHQRKLLRNTPVLPQADSKADVRYASIYLEKVRQYEKDQEVSLLTQRLTKALQFVHRTGRADELDDELRFIADGAVAKTDADYGLVRLILWAVPMLGFLGTVIGITAALDNLDLNAINESSKQLSAGLAVAFDTTGLAITLDVLLFFIQFLVYREEMQLLGETERLAADELRGRFANSEERITNCGSCAYNSILAPHNTPQTVETLRQMAVEMVSLRHETIQQTETLQRVLGSHSELLHLEERLRENLAALSNVGNFEDTVHSLAAAIHLLNKSHRRELRVASGE